MPRSTNTPTIMNGRYFVFSPSTAPMLLSSGWTMRSIITSVDATSTMPTIAMPNTALYGRT